MTRRPLPLLRQGMVSTADVAPDAPALEATQLQVHRGAQPILRDVSLTVRHGELVALIGPNGAGKSTLLSTLSGEQRVERGEVRVAGAALLELTPMERARRRAMLPQHAALSFDLPVRDVVCMGRTPFSEGPAVSRGIAEAALLAVELDALRARGYLALSGGERQRVQLARFLAQVWPDADGAAVGLLDEPVASLDPRQQHRSMAVLRSVARAGRAVVIVLHDLALASLYADRVVVMRDGRILAEGAPSDALTCDVLEAAFDTRFGIRHDAAGHPLALPCVRCDTLACAACARHMIHS